MHTANVLLPLYLPEEHLPHLVSEQVSVVILCVLYYNRGYARCDILRGELPHAVQTRCETRIVKDSWEVGQGGRVRQVGDR